MGKTSPERASPPPGILQDRVIGPKSTLGLAEDPSPGIATCVATLLAVQLSVDLDLDGAFFFFLGGGIGPFFLASAAFLPFFMDEMSGTSSQGRFSPSTTPFAAKVVPLTIWASFFMSIFFEISGKGKPNHLEKGHLEKGHLGKCGTHPRHPQRELHRLASLSLALSPSLDTIFLESRAKLLRKDLELKMPLIG
ncbi:hypothetical protein Acr_25g0003150 [Actinidia rufa]|uniref:Uncharacterized protein n=1 Tax=Actinidia rufa TaxID=165716 RepID=A0A7J0GYM5_9ERIC|nr:hypothetical protein Acr_25g0003150 [Actinidia rufa]